MNANTKILSDYSSVVNDKGELLLFIDSPIQEQSGDNIILYDGGDHAFFYRNKSSKEVIIIDYLDVTAQDAMKTSRSVKIAELDKNRGNVIRDYDVPVKKVPMLPNKDVMSTLKGFDEILEQAKNEINSKFFKGNTSNN